MRREVSFGIWICVLLNTFGCTLNGISSVPFSSGMPPSMLLPEFVHLCNCFILPGNATWDPVSFPSPHVVICSQNVQSLPPPGRNICDFRIIALYSVFLKSLLNLLWSCFLLYVLHFGPGGRWGFDFPNQDQTSSPCLGRGSLGHCPAREVPVFTPCMSHWVLPMFCI